MLDNRDLSFIQRFVDSALENTRNELWNKMIGMSRPQRLVLNDNLLFCPACGKFFSEEHADQNPNFCEECGQAFEWPEEDDDTKKPL